MTNPILVVGGTGMLGEPVARRLHADGYPVRIFTRTPEKARAKWGPEYDIAGGDVEDQQALARAMVGCQAVHINLAGGLDPDLERRGAENVARIAARHGIQHLTLLSGASVRQENCWNAGIKAKFHAEAAVRASGVPYTIFQATFFMESLPLYMQGTRALHVGNQPHPRHWVAADDYARMVSRTYTTPTAAGKTLHIFGPNAWTQRQALQTYCNIVRPDAKIATIPFWMTSLVARITRNQALDVYLPFFRYTEQVAEEGNPVEANALLGAPTTSLEAWCTAQVGQRKIA